MASLIVEVGKTSDVRSKAKEIYDIYRCIFFRNMEEFKVSNSQGFPSGFINEGPRDSLCGVKGSLVMIQGFVVLKR